MPGASLVTGIANISSTPGLLQASRATAAMQMQGHIA
jgi:hypothetical protein